MTIAALVVAVCSRYMYNSSLDFWFKASVRRSFASVFYGAAYFKTVLRQGRKQSVARAPQAPYILHLLEHLL